MFTILQVMFSEPQTLPYFKWLRNYWTTKQAEQGGHYIQTNLITASVGHIALYCATAPIGPGLPHYRALTNTFSHNTVGKTPLDEWWARRQEPLLDNAQHSQETDIHALGGFRTHNPNKRAAAQPLFRPRGICDRPSECKNSEYM